MHVDINTAEMLIGM